MYSVVPSQTGQREKKAMTDLEYEVSLVISYVLCLLCLFMYLLQADERARSLQCRLFMLLLQADESVPLLHLHGHGHGEDGDLQRDLSTVEAALHVSTFADFIIKKKCVSQ